MKALIAMSGGVDSSVTAALMKERGYECAGVMMKLHDDGASSDLDDAREAAARMGIPFCVADYRDAFKCSVMAPFVDCYLQGMTPNPCISCNRHLKFRKLFEKADELGCDVIATGHYATVEKNEKSGRYMLKKAVYQEKDQSYVLYSLTQEQLARVVLPLGGYAKDDVRKLAEKHMLFNADKKDSQDICFIPDGDYKKFIETYRGAKCEPGNFVTEDGKILGQHKGIICYTIGQRKGLGISANEPLFVKEIKADTNEVVLCGNDALFKNTLYAEDVNWVSIEEPDEGVTLHVKAKIRYKHKESPAAVTREGKRIKVVFEEPQRAVTKGQAVVLYDGDLVVGGGTICG